MLLAPLSKRQERFVEGRSFGCEGVNDLGRNLLINFPADHTVSFKFAELLGEHLLRDTRQFAPEFTGAPRLVA